VQDEITRLNAKLLEGSRDRDAAEIRCADMKRELDQNKELKLLVKRQMVVVGDIHSIWENFKYVTFFILFLRICLNFSAMLMHDFSANKQFFWDDLDSYVVYVNWFESCVFAIYLFRLCAYVVVTCCRRPRILAPAAQDCGGWSALVCLRFLTVDHFFRYTLWVKSYVESQCLITCLTCLYFVILVPVCGSIGIVALAIKIDIVSHGLQTYHDLTLCNLLKLSVFANQMLCMTDTSAIRMAQQQIAIFDRDIHEAGGGDAEIDTHERHRITCFFDDCAEKVLNSNVYDSVQKAVVLATFNHNDLHKVSLPDVASDDQTFEDRIKGGRIKGGRLVALLFCGAVSSERSAISALLCAWLFGGTLYASKPLWCPCFEGMCHHLPSG